MLINKKLERVKEAFTYNFKVVL